MLNAVFKTILARLLTLPACPHPVVYYGALITEICKVGHAQFNHMRLPFFISPNPFISSLPAKEAQPLDAAFVGYMRG